jgi:hypothetical protein
LISKHYIPKILIFPHKAKEGFQDTQDIIGGEPRNIKLYGLTEEEIEIEESQNR